MYQALRWDAIQGDWVPCLEKCKYPVKNAEIENKNRRQKYERGKI